MTSQAAIVYRITSASTVVSRACFCKQQRWVLESNRRVGVWSFPWRWHIRSILSMTGRGISAETCGLDDVFPPDDLCSRPGALCHCIFIYTYAYFIRVLVIGCIDCPCGVWCRGLTTCLLYVDPLFGYLLLNNSWAVGLTCWIVNSHYVFVFWHI